MRRIADAAGCTAAIASGAMTTTSLPVLAGIVSTAIFATSTLPMLVKAHRSKDLSSYSLGNLVLANAGNVVHSVYVLALPAGPIWGLHGFYTVTSGLMLVWYLRGASAGAVLRPPVAGSPSARPRPGRRSRPPDRRRRDPGARPRPTRTPRGRR